MRHHPKLYHSDLSLDGVVADKTEVGERASLLFGLSGQW